MVTVTVARRTGEAEFNDIRLETANGPDNIAEHLLTVPLAERFFSGMGKAEVDRPGETLLRSIEAARGPQPGCANHAEVGSLFGADQVLAAIAARERKVSGAKMAAARERSEQCGVHVVRMRGDHQARAKRAQTVERELDVRGAARLGRECDPDQNQRDNEPQRHRSFSV